MVAALILLLILALIFGGVGLLVEGLFWLFVIGLILFVVGGILGFFNRGFRSGRGW